MITRFLAYACGILIAFTAGADRLFAQEPDRPAKSPQESAQTIQLVAAESVTQTEVVYAGLSAEKAAEVMTLPAGFHATVFAAEPDVQQPIAMTIDDRGRLWVAEGYAYPSKRPAGEANDRILIFDDEDGDGHFDTRKVFTDGLNLVSGLEVGFGGVWVGQAPELLFIPDRDGDDVPDDKPVTLLDGWGYQDTHETLNAFIWGPDGWLYGCHGVFTHSRVGKPGTPDDQRIPLNAGIWRYHPTRHEFEVFANGTSNPWGVDFNERGQAFLTSCVIPHLFHMIYGARYNRQGGRHFNPYTYDDIPTIADHLHYAGNIRDHAHWGRTPEVPAETVAAGGGHAHAGAMIYLGGAWPREYRDKIFMNNIHGARVNMDILEPEGSGYVGRHGKDLLVAHDKASQILYLRYGPDGQVYFIDWYDENQCHHREDEAHDRTNGRIYKITYGESRPVRVDLKQLSNDELVELQLNENDWYGRQSRRILQERAAEGQLPADSPIFASLADLAFEHADETRRLRGLWALHVTGGLTGERVSAGLANDNAYVRAWTIQLALENRTASADMLTTFASLAQSDPSPVVRLYLASALQKLPLQQRWDIIAGLITHGEDTDDHNLPLMYWYALEPLAAADMRRALALIDSAEIPALRAFTLRRIAEIGSPEAIAMLVESLGTRTNDDSRLTYLSSIREALKGRRRYPMPQQWPRVATALAKSDAIAVQDQTRALAVTFGDSQALEQMRTRLRDTNVAAEQRKAALESLLAFGDERLAPILQSLIVDTTVRREVLRGLAAYTHPQTPRRILDQYASFSAEEKRDALNTLASRVAYANTMLQAVADKTVASNDLSADIIRQLRNLDDKALLKRINEVWGVVRDTPADRKKMIADYRKLIKSRGPEPDVSLGRAVFAKTCQQCHKLFSTGGVVGPDLTGSNRRDLDYLLSNVIDPSAVMAKDYQPAIVVTEAGRTITGIIKEQSTVALTLATANETVVVPRDEIEFTKVSDKSMMPDNLWQPLSEHEVRSLVAYLAGSAQVSMLATPDTVKNFFNGQDLAGWNGAANLWTVEDGTIVGRSQGLKHNEFLTSDLLVGDFELRVDVRLTPNTENSGIQFRSRPLPNGEVQGYQADIGAGWWGKLYEERGRALLWDKSGEAFVKPNEWNAYRIVAVGDRVRTYLNGHLCVDLDDPAGAKRGIIALQLHAGGPMEIRFRNLQLTVDPQILTED